MNQNDRKRMLYEKKRTKKRKVQKRRMIIAFTVSLEQFRICCISSYVCSLKRNFVREIFERSNYLEISFEWTVVFIVMVEARTCEEIDKATAPTMKLTIFRCRTVGTNVLVRHSSCVFEDLRDMIREGNRYNLLTLSFPSIPDTFWFHLQ